jgi:hypothetical protein
MNHEYISRPSYEYVNPVYLNSLYDCIAFYSKFKNTLANLKKVDKSSRQAWHLSLTNVYMFVHGHLNAEKDDKFKRLVKDMDDWIGMKSSIDDNALLKYTVDLIDYYYKLGLTKVEVINNHKPYSSLV